MKNIQKTCEKITPLTKNKDCGCGCGNKGKLATLNLPVAPTHCARIRFAAMDVAARAIPPKGALAWLEENLSQGAKIEGVTLAGPGDPLAEIEPTKESIGLIKGNHPDIRIRLTTLGIHGEKYADELVQNGVTHVCLLVDAVDAEVAQKLYAWIRPGKKNVPLKKAAELLISEQEKAVIAFKNSGCTVSIKTTVYPGYNDLHIEEIAQKMASLGVEALTLAPFRPGAESIDDMPPAPTEEQMAEINQKAGTYITSRICKETTPSIIGKDCASISGKCKIGSAFIPKPSKDRPNVAVASLSGMDVDLHLGQAYQFLIYGPREDGLTCLLETRPAPEPGDGDTRWQVLGKRLGDCFALLASGAGQKPRNVLADAGITVLVTEDEIEGTVDVLYGGGKKKKKC